MKRIASASLHVAMVASAIAPFPAAAALIDTPFISEYVEGSSFNKAVEIFNGTGRVIDLDASGFQLEIFSNGSTTSSSTIDLSGELIDGGTFVVANARADSALTSVAGLQTGGLNFNGDDALVLRSNSMILDVIGRIGEDPGSQWTRDGIGTRDETLRRAPSIRSGDSNGFDAFDPSAGWLSFGKDQFDGLGTHATTVGPTRVPAPAPLALLVIGLLGLASTRRDPGGVAGTPVADR